MGFDRESLQAARDKWTWTGASRPPWAEDPSDGQVSVWDFPRPPIMEPEPRRVSVRYADVTIADSTSAIRLLETAGAPALYIPPADIDFATLVRVSGSSVCEWKGVAEYWSVSPDLGVEVPTNPVGWDYPDPFEPFESLAGWLSFYPAIVECSIDGEIAQPQPGGLYGGWVTSELSGPIKGGPGTSGW